MKQKIAKLLLSALIVFGVSFTSMSSSYAAEGGRVQTEGAVGFYTDEVPASSSDEPTTASSAEQVVTKPTGKLPSTGELIQTGAAISGLVILVAFLVLFFWKRRKKDEEERQGNI